MKKNKKGGFTLTEILATIAILAVIITIIILIIRVTTKDVVDKLDEVTKNMILEAAREYTLEYRGTDRWKEEKTSDGASFCVSLDSLLESGYFKNEESNYEKFRTKYTVSGIVVDGNFKFELMELSSVSQNSMCEYIKRDHMLLEKDEESGQYVEVDKINKITEITNEDKNLGRFEYDLTAVNNKYKMNTNLEVSIKEFIKDNSNIFVNILLDESRSMKNAYNSAVDAIIGFSETLSNSGISHSLIGFGGYPLIRRNYSADKLSSSDFAPYGSWAWATNSHAAVDLVTSLIYNSKQAGIMNEDSKIYTVLFTDGQPLEWLWITDSNNSTKYDIYTMKSDGYNLKTNEKAKIYYSMYKDLVDGCESPYADYEQSVDATHNFECKKENERYYITFRNNWDVNKAWDYLRYSSGFLKSVGSKIIVAAYVVDFGSKSKLEDVVSADDFCEKSSKDGYCYYYSKNVEQVNDLFAQFSNMFEALTVIDKVKLKLDPIKDSGGIPLVKIYDADGNEINDFDEVDLSFEDQEQLNILNKFSFVINEASDLFDVDNGLWRCTDDKYSCTYEGAKKLFDIKLSLHYKKDNSWSDVTIVQPEFDLNLTKISTVN